MDLVLWVIFGALAGYFAYWIMRGESENPVLNVIIGITGALVGGVVMNTIGEPGIVGGFNIYSLFVATLGAVILLAVVRALRT